MEQRCHLGMIWLTWLGLPLLSFVVVVRLGLLTGVFVLAVGVVAQVLYLRWFPKLSVAMGYGSVADAPATTLPVLAPQKVTLYTASVCPFCPLIRERLAGLQRHMGFEIQEIDVTFRPEIIRAKGLRSVPVLESKGQFLVGNATTAQIAEFLAPSAIASR